MVALTQVVAGILRRYDVDDEIIGELVTTAKKRMRSDPAIEGQAAAA